MVSVFYRITVRSRFVVTAKIICALASMLMVIAILVLPSWRTKPTNQLDVVEVNEDKEAIVQGTSVSNAEFHGVNSKGDNYNIKAVHAQEKNKDEVALETIVTEILRGDKKLGITSSSAMWFKSKRILYLPSIVEALYNMDYKLNASEVEADLYNNRITSSKPVTISAKEGKINASSFDIDLISGKVILQDPKVVINAN
jgi:LPS export ABC transporter protein LptC